MKVSCPVCDNTKGVESIKKEKTIMVRNESVAVDMEYHKCSECGEEFLVPDPDNDPFERAYRLYRANHGMLQPEEIRTFRQNYSITQGELAKLLGLGGATLSRYENNELQDKTHDTLIRMAMEPDNLRELVFNSTNVFSADKRNRILHLIDEGTESKAGIFDRIIAITFQRHKPDEFSGFKKFENEKFLNAVLYFCKSGVIKTKLNKLLFYADFKHFKEHTVSITGMRYARVPFGPAPDNYDLYYPALIRQGAIEVEEVDYGGYTGEKYIAKEEPNLNLFSASELYTLVSVNEHFKEFNARDISDFSHAEKGYQDTETGDPISYRYAQDLKL